MANAYGNTTKLFSTPYITTDEYKQAPTAIDYDNLVVGSTDPAVQTAELANMIGRASSWIDTYCNQVLSATTETENFRSRLRPDGFLSVHPKYFPIISVSSLLYGVTPNDLISYYDPSQGWVEDQQFIVPYTTANSTSSQGPLAFGIPATPRAQVFVQMTYVSGYANTTLGANTSAGATSITVADASGIVAGSRMAIYNGLNTENIVVASSYTYGSATVPLVSALAYAHTKGVSVSALPPAVKEAAILATTAMLKVRGDYSLTMMATNQVGTAGLNTAGSDYDLSLAKELLLPFRRVR